MSDEQWYTPPEDEASQPDKAARRTFLRGLFLGIALTLALGIITWALFGEGGIETSLATIDGAMRTKSMSTIISVMVVVLLVTKLVLNPRAQAAQARYRQRKQSASIIVLIGMVVLAIIFGLFKGF